MAFDAVSSLPFGDDPDDVRDTCRCGGEEALAEHVCPFAEEIHGDSITLCTCCAACEYECAMDI